MDIHSPNIERLLSAFHHVKADRVPNFEIMMDKKILSYLLKKPVEGTLWSIEPELAVQAISVVGQDAIPCPLHFNPRQASVLSMEDLKKIVLPDVRLARAKMERYLKATKDTKIGICACMTGPLTSAYMALGPTAIESFMYLVYDDPDLVEQTMDLFVDYYVEVIHEIRNLPFHFFYLGDDIGFNNGPMLNPTMLRELWAPRYQKMIEAAKSTGKEILCHCCGHQGDVLPYFVEWKVNATHPIQPGANDIYELHQQYGKDLAFVGNIDVCAMLSMAKPDEIKKDVKEHIERLGANGGYIAGSSHSIIDSVIPENYMAMVEAIHEYGKY